MKNLRVLLKPGNIPPRSRMIFLRREFDAMGGKVGTLARFYRRTFLRRTRIVAVTGSVGKTSTKRALDTALATPDRGFSYSNYGFSLFANVLRIRAGDAHAVLEIGVAGPGRMASYAAVVRPDVAVVTAISSDHNRSFATLEDTRREKAEIVRALPADGIAILNGDDPHVRWMSGLTKARVITFGSGPGNDLRAHDLRRDESNRLVFEIEVGGRRYPALSPLAGDLRAYEFLAAVAAAWVSGIPPETAIARLARMTPASSRLEVLELADGTRVLDDSCKASLETIHASFDALRTLGDGRKIVVLGTIEEPGISYREEYKDLGKRLAGFADLVICVGGSIQKRVRTGADRAGMGRESVIIAGHTVRDALAVLAENRRPGDLILVKGTSSQRLRRIVLGLQGVEFSCQAIHCGVKVRSCDECPLLNAPMDFLDNQYVRRYFKSRSADMERQPD